MPSSAFQTCALDRKSTRLNSSHTIISYAVFCLKKNQTQQPSRDTVPPDSAERTPRRGREQRALAVVGTLGALSLATAVCVIGVMFFFYNKGAPPNFPPFPPRPPPHV